MAPGLVVLALGQLLDRGEAALTVADVDWQRFVPAFTAMRPSPLLAGVPEAQAAAAAERGRADGGEPAEVMLAGRLEGLTRAEQEQAVLELVQAQAARCWGTPRLRPSRRALRSASWGSTP